MRYAPLSRNSLRLWGNADNVFTHMVILETTQIIGKRISLACYGYLQIVFQRETVKTVFSKCLVFWEMAELGQNPPKSTTEGRMMHIPQKRRNETSNDESDIAMNYSRKKFRVQSFFVAVIRAIPPVSLEQVSNPILTYSQAAKSQSCCTRAIGWWFCRYSLSTRSPTKTILKLDFLLTFDW